MHHEHWDITAGTHPITHTGLEILYAQVSVRIILTTAPQVFWVAKITNVFIEF